MSDTTITAYQLGELLKKVQAHAGRHSAHPAIAGVRLDYDGRHLHAIATDRYTLAVARQHTEHGGAPWARTISAREEHNDLALLTAALATVPGETTLHLIPGADSLALTSTRGSVTIPASDGYFPDWRGLLRTALHTAPTEAPFSGFQSDLLARWQDAGRHITTWQAAFDEPVVVYGHNFVGLQMPRRLSDDESPASRWKEWRSSLDTDDPKVTQAQTINHWEATDLKEKPNTVAEAAADLLKQVLRSTSDVFNAATGDHAALAAYASAGGRAWLAYRLLNALQKADPDLLRATLADTDEQLESGEIGEWAWEEARKAGHDPQRWHDDYAAHLQALATKDTTTPASTEAAASRA